jgi:hypothetical protein
VILRSENTDSNSSVFGSFKRMSFAGIDMTGLVRDIQMAADKAQHVISLWADITMVFEYTGEAQAKSRRFISHPAKRI